jgi:hypothetical protein
MVFRPKFLQSKSELADIICALRSLHAASGTRKRRQQQRRQYPNDGENHEQFDDCERRTVDAASAGHAETMADFAPAINFQIEAACVLKDTWVGRRGARGATRPTIAGSRLLWVIWESWKLSHEPEGIIDRKI